MKKNGNYAGLFIGLGAARQKMLPPVVARSISLGDLIAQRHLGMDLVSRLAKRLGKPVPAEFAALSAALEIDPVLHQECRDLLGQLEAGNFIVFI